MGGGFDGGCEALTSADWESMECDSGDNPETGIWRRVGDVERKRRATAIGQGNARGFGRVGISSGDRSMDSGVKNGDRLHEDFEQSKLAKVDVWSLGWLLFYTCTGMHPGHDVWASPTGLSERESTEVLIFVCGLWRTGSNGLF